MPTGGLGYGLGSNRPANRHSQFQEREERRRCYERLELRHAASTGLGGKDMDGRERRTSRTVTSSEGIAVFFLVSTCCDAHDLILVRTSMLNYV